MRRQRGVTMIGWIFLLTPMALVLYAGIRLGPEYMNYYKLKTAMIETAKKLEADESLNPQSIRRALERRFDTGYIDKPTADEIEISKVEGGWEMSTDFESEVPFIGNVYLVVDFSTTAKISTN